MSKFGGYEDQPFIAELYDHLPGYAGRVDVDFYTSYSQAIEGKILELGCGTGRILIPTAEAGCHIVGLDLSEYMLGNCREKLKRKPQDVRARVSLIQGDMTNFKLDETYALVTTPFRPFQHLVSVDNQLACLRCVNRHLQIGGKLILDLFQVNLRYLCSPDYSKETEDCSNVELPGGRKLRRTHRIAGQHRAEQYNDVEMIFYITHPDGHEEKLVWIFQFRYFFRYEVQHLLERCGFSTVDVFGNYDKSPLTDDSPEMVFVAKKIRELDPDKKSR